MTAASVRVPDSWLAFELNILRRLEFNSIAVLGAKRPHLGAYLKQWGSRIYTNNITLSDHVEALAAIQNNTVLFEESDVEAVLTDVYVPQYQFGNPLFLLRVCVAKSRWSGF